MPMTDRHRATRTELPAATRAWLLPAQRHPRKACRNHCHVRRGLRSRRMEDAVDLTGRANNGGHKTQIRIMAREASGALRSPVPSRIACWAASAPFTIHGHRLSSLYRGYIQGLKPFIILKILKTACLRMPNSFEYLGNSEIGKGAS